MRYAVRACARAASPRTRIYLSMERNMQCAVGLCGHCQLGPQFVCKDGPVFQYRGRASGCSAVTTMKPRLAVFKFASCDGCQLRSSTSRTSC